MSKFFDAAVRQGGQFYTRTPEARRGMKNDHRGANEWKRINRGRVRAVHWPHRLITDQLSLSASDDFDVQHVVSCFQKLGALSPW